MGNSNSNALLTKVLFRINWRPERISDPSQIDHPSPSTALLNEQPVLVASSVKALYLLPPLSSSASSKRSLVFSRQF